jgi:hypothetical protein
MSFTSESPDRHIRRFGRRPFLAASVGAGAAVALPQAAQAAVTSYARSGPATGAAPAASGRQPLPPVLRSRLALTGPQSATSTLPITQNGTTYNLAQEVRWLDAEHFAVGRWDGTMSLFEFETAPFVGPLVTAAVNTPSAQGVQMITPLPRRTIVTSNDWSSIAVWAPPDADWAGLKMRRLVSYDASLGVATNGAWFADQATLVVGHDSGYLSMWRFDAPTRGLSLIRTINVQNPNPVNPFGSHVIYGMCPLVASGPGATVVAGSDDGYISLVRVASGAILSQTVFNPAAQRGINSVSARGDKILVANCSVGSADKNLWYFSVDFSSWALTLLDSMNLIIDTSRVQAFNFDTIWGQYSGGDCWFAGTEEGALWMGTADTGLHLIGQQDLFDGAIGAALDYTSGPGRLAAVIHNLDQFTTGAA